jgi:hypothetical protein
VNKKPQKLTDRNKRFARKKPDKLPAAKILIVVEGQSEEKYFNALKNLWKLHTAFIVYKPDCTDPISLLEAALKQFDPSTKNNSILVNSYEEIWIVYDLEKPNDERRKQSQQAKKQADNCVAKYNRTRRGKINPVEINFAISDPSFEFWYVLHYEPTTKSFTGASEVEDYLKCLWKGYAKNSQPTQEILDTTQTAIENAEWVRKQNGINNSTAPMTDIDKIVDRLKPKDS